MNLGEMQALVLGYLRRPETEVGTEVIASINRVVQNAVSSHDFIILQQVENVTYDANESSVPLDTLLGDSTFKSLISVQTLFSVNVLEGDPLKVITYAEILKWKQRLRDTAESEIDLVNSDYLAFVRGQDTKLELGLWPIPSEAVFLRLDYNSRLPLLVADEDTNFLLTYFPDFILFSVCFSLLFYLRTDERAMFTAEQIAIEWDKVMSWDSKLSPTSGTRV